MKLENQENNAEKTEGIKMLDYERRISGFGKRLRFLRRSAGFTSESLAAFLGVSTPYIGLIERGERRPSLEIFVRICEFFGESCDEMIKEAKIPFLAEGKGTEGAKRFLEMQMLNKKKTIMGMLDSFDLDGLDHISVVIKSLNKYKTPSEKMGETDEFAEETSPSVTGQKAHNERFDDF